MKTLYVLSTSTPGEAFDLMVAWFRSRTGDSVFEVTTPARLPGVTTNVGRFTAITVPGPFEGVQRIARAAAKLHPESMVVILRLAGDAKVDPKLTTYVIPTPETVKGTKARLKFFVELERIWNEVRRFDGVNAKQPPAKPKLPWE